MSVTSRHKMMYTVSSAVLVPDEQTATCHTVAICVLEIKVILQPRSENPPQCPHRAGVGDVSLLCSLPLCHGLNATVDEHQAKEEAGPMQHVHQGAKSEEDKHPEEHCPDNSEEKCLVHEDEGHVVEPEDDVEDKKVVD
eukprot:CAMPEP_0179030034 /NCGR_PEP_ID=MMETSP0796-20121207/10362_1 /TAXON_ID=73915 /ORGANISM="Pyrodinium bahamense, Strain pbaha01" /LENGTH=138 /DNA_ID=CAMNT_0020726213 /DNA_START=388 /DNA_END=804 /DNA_ORIENTATION=-